jgi:hypothetical protein
VLATAVLLLLAGAHVDANENVAVARSAARYLRDKPRLRREDCSGLVNDIMRDAGIASSGSTRAMFVAAEREGRLVNSEDDVRPGDVVFFDRTYDSNRNGKVDDTLTHVAVVTTVAADGTVHMVHRAASSIAELKMHLRSPHDAQRNSYLRRPGYGGKGAPRLAGELYRGHARPPFVRTTPRTLVAHSSALIGDPPPSLADICAICEHPIFGR